MPGLNYNYNYNYNYAAGGGGSGLSLRFRPRYNTAEFSGAYKDPRDLVPPRPKSGYVKFHENWDADLRSYAYLAAAFGVIGDPVLKYGKTVKAVSLPPDRLPQPDLNSQVAQVLDMVLERENRYLEVIDQDDGDGAINYQLSLLKIDPAHHPMTNLMVRVGRRIGEYVVMCLKDHFKSPRPSQLCPAIMPMIDPPATPAYPAGHSLQAWLIAYLIAYSLPKLPMHHKLWDAEGIPSPKDAEGPLFQLANRIAENRVVAGIHFPIDNEAGKQVAIACFEDLMTVGSIWTGVDEKGKKIPSIRAGVRSEFSQFT